MQQPKTTPIEDGIMNGHTARICRVTIRGIAGRPVKVDCQITGYRDGQVSLEVPPRHSSIRTLKRLAKYRNLRTISIWIPEVPGKSPRYLLTSIQAQVREAQDCLYNGKRGQIAHHYVRLQAKWSISRSGGGR